MSIGNVQVNLLSRHFVLFFYLVDNRECWNLKGEGKRFLHGVLICTYTIPEYICDI